MYPRSALFLLAAAGSLAPGGGGASTLPPTTTATLQETTGDEFVEKKGGDGITDKLRKEWHSKSYAEIAAHHVELTQLGRHDEAAVFHDAVVKTYRDPKPAKK